MSSVRTESSGVRMSLYSRNPTMIGLPENPKDEYTDELLMNALNNANVKKICT